MVDSHVCGKGELSLHRVQYMNSKVRLDTVNRRTRRQLAVQLCRRMQKPVSEWIGVGRGKVGFYLFLDAVVILYAFVHTHCESNQPVPMKRTIVVDCMCWWSYNRKLCERLKLEVSNGYMNEAEITLFQLTASSH